MTYFTTPNYCIPLNAKVASSALCRRLVAKYYPELESQLATAAYPEGFNADKLQLHALVPKVARPDRPVAMLVREPVNRFLSGVTYLDIDLDAAIDSLQTGARVASRARPGKGIKVSRNVHFAKQTAMMSGETHLFRFPDHLAAFAQLIGVGQLPKLNVTPRSKPVLTEAQSQAIAAFYADDVALYNSIEQPNTIVAAPVIPEETLEQEMARRLRRLAEKNE